MTFQRCCQGSCRVTSQADKNFAQERKWRIIAVSVFLWLLVGGGGGLRPAAAQTTVSGTIGADTTWTLASSPYIVTGHIVVNAGVTLTIEPGVEVRFTPGRGYKLTVKGTLTAVGLAEAPIVFTSDSPTPAVNQWGYIYMYNAGSSGSALDHVVVEYSQYGIYMLNSSPVIRNSHIQNNSWGFYIKYASNPVIENNVISNNTSRGMYLYANVGEIPLPEIHENIIENNGGYNLYCANYSRTDASGYTVNATENWWGTNDPVAIADSIYDNADNSKSAHVNFTPFWDSPEGGVAESATIVSGSLTADTTWAAADSPFLVVGDILVPTGVTLTIEPGVEVRFSAGLSMTVEGTVIATGTEGAEIVLTSDRETPAAGDWEKIYLTRFSQDSVLSYVRIEYANTGLHLEAYISSNLPVAYVSPRISHSVFQFNNVGIEVGKFSNPMMTWNTLTNNGTGLKITTNAAQPARPVVSDNALTGNLNYDFEAVSAGGDASSEVVNVENNWWGATDPAQIAQQIRDFEDTSSRPHADFEPFLNQPPSNEVQMEIGQIQAAPVVFDPAAGTSTTIQYELNKPGLVTISISNFDSGQPVRTVIQGASRAAGLHSEVWDGRDQAGSLVAPDTVCVFTIYADDPAGPDAEYAPFFYPGRVSLLNGQTTPEFNPYFGETAKAQYELAAPSRVTVKVGLATELQEDAIIIDAKPRNAGVNAENWNGRRDDGSLVDIIKSYDFYGWADLLPENSLVISATPPESGALSALFADPYAVYPIYGEETTIQYILQAAATVTLEVLTPDGSGLVRTLEENEPRTAGTYSVSWTARDDDGHVVGSEGDYRLRLTAQLSGGNTITREGNIRIMR